MNTLHQDRLISGLHALSVEETGTLSKDAKTLIEQVAWGTEGALYWVKNYPQSLAAIPNLRYLNLYKNGRLIGLRIVVPKTIHCNGQSYQAVYHSLFAIDPAERGKGYGKYLARATVEWGEAQMQGRGLVYAFTEAGNETSRAIKEAQGYEPIGRFHSIAFSRFFPKTSPNVHRLTPADRKDMVQHLNAQYADHAMTDFESSLLTDHYFVLKENNRVVAGLQVDFHEWQMKHLAGVGGWIAMNIFPHIPLLRDQFNPPNFRFLRLGNFFFENNRAEAAYELIEAVMAIHGVHTALAFLDKKSPIYTSLARAGSFGLVNWMVETYVDVTASLQGLPRDVVNEFGQRPLVVSPIDI